MALEKEARPISGYLMLAIGILSIPMLIMSMYYKLFPVAAISLISMTLALSGLFMVNPNGSKVLVLFGKYQGTVKQNGFFWTNPFYRKFSISLRARNFDSERVKVNDKIGNPILISAILVWRVKNTYKAAFEVDNYQSFVRVQSDAAVRKLAGTYPYDNFDDREDEVTLRSGLNEINDALEKELDERLSIAGIEVMEARIGYLAYSEEIAGAMLKRQQATAVVAARKKIVEGAVGMVEAALEELSKKEIIHLDEDKKASMVSNLMVVLCSDKETAPIVNTSA